MKTTPTQPRPTEQQLDGAEKAMQAILGTTPEIKTHPTQSLADFYAAVESAPPEWLPSMLNKVVKQALQSGIWSSPENLILSVQGFAKLPQ